MDDIFGLTIMTDTFDTPIIRRKRGKLKHKEIDGVHHIFCSICNKWLPIDKYARSHGPNRGPRARQSTCKDCQCTYSKKHNARRKQLRQ